MFIFIYLSYLFIKLSDCYNYFNFIVIVYYCMHEII